MVHEKRAEGERRSRGQPGGEGDVLIQTEDREDVTLGGGLGIGKLSGARTCIVSAKEKNTLICHRVWVLIWVW